MRQTIRIQDEILSPMDQVGSQDIPEFIGLVEPVISDVIVFDSSSERGGTHAPPDREFEAV